MIRIEAVEPGSVAGDLGVMPGDSILTINGHAVDDILDYYLQLEQDSLVFEILHNEELWELKIEKDAVEDIGLSVEHPQPQQCGNQCVFCFVHQLPKGMRPTLYIKDEDYRFSYLYGSYITLTNIREEEIDRILTEQLSPLYISVHASEHQLRNRLLGVDAPPLLPLLKRLTDGGITLHCQIVLCPGYNDGDALKQTVMELAAFYPRIASLAVVPVGLTRFRKHLPELKPVSEADAQASLDLIGACQEQLLERCGSRFVFAADELYLQAQRPIPPVEHYEECEQLENGVGMIAQFRQQAEEVLLEAEALELSRVTLVCGKSFAAELENFCQRLSLRTGVAMEVVAIENAFFGSTVTVSGLLTGADVQQQLRGRDLGAGLLIADVMLRHGEEKFLDDLCVDDLRSQLQLPVEIVDSSPWGVLEGLEALAYGPEVILCRE